MTERAAAGQRDLLFDPGRVDPGRPALRFRAAHRLPDALPLVRHRLLLLRRQLPDLRRDRGGDRRPRLQPGRADRRRAAAPEGEPDPSSPASATRATRCCSRPAAASTSRRSTRGCGGSSTSNARPAAKAAIITGRTSMRCGRPTSSRWCWRAKRTTSGRATWCCEKKLAEICPVHFSPVHGEIVLEELAAWILRDRLPVRLQVQLHKLIWDPQRRGV